MHRSPALRGVRVAWPYVGAPAFVRSTTVLAVRRGGSVAFAGDGQVTAGTTIVKSGANKIRRLYDGKVLAGFAGTAADAFTLFEKFEGRIKEYSGDILRAAVEMAKEWRTDRSLRHLEALLLVADENHLLEISGNGDVIEPDGEGDAGIAAVGSGGAFALAAARALVSETKLGAKAIAEKSLRIAAALDIYTNDHLVVETLPS